MVSIFPRDNAFTIRVGISNSSIRILSTSSDTDEETKNNEHEEYKLIAKFHTLSKEDRISILKIDEISSNIVNGAIRENHCATNKSNKITHLFRHSDLWKEPKTETRQKKKQNLIKTNIGDICMK